MSAADRRSDADQPGHGGPDSGRLTAIVSPLPAELRAVRALTAIERTAGGLAFGRLGGAPVVLAATGDGAPAAARGLAALFAAARVDRLLVLGVAGGLSPDLAPGDLLAARRVIEDGRAAPPPDAGWLAAAVAGGAVSGTAVSSARILVTPAEKRAVFRALAASGAAGPATVDLESATYARLAAERGIPYLVVRAVIDAAGEPLPLDFNRARGAGGGVREARVVGMALARPQVWGALAQLRRRLRGGARGLARLAVLLAPAAPEPAEDEISIARGSRAAGRAR